MLSLGAQSSRASNHGVSMNRTTDVGTNGTPTIAGGVPLTFSENFTQGATGRGTVSLAGGGHPFTTETSLLNLNYRFDDGRWKIESGVSQSDSSRTRTNTGQFSGLNSTLTNPARVVFSDNNKNPERPGTIRVFDNSNREIDIYDIRNYRATTATLGPITTPRSRGPRISTSNAGSTSSPFRSPFKLAACERISGRHQDEQLDL